MLIINLSIYDLGPSLPDQQNKSQTTRRFTGHCRDVFRKKVSLSHLFFFELLPTHLLQRQHPYCFSCCFFFFSLILFLFNFKVPSCFLSTRCLLLFDHVSLNEQLFTRSQQNLSEEKKGIQLRNNPLCNLLWFFFFFFLWWLLLNPNTWKKCTLKYQGNEVLPKIQEPAHKAVGTGTEALFLASLEQKSHPCLNAHLTAVARR